MHTGALSSHLIVKMFAVPGGRHLDAALELAVEMNFVGVTADLRDLFEGQTRCFQQILGIVDAHLDIILLKGNPKLLCIQMLEMGFADTDLLCDFISAQGIIQGTLHGNPDSLECGLIQVVGIRGVSLMESGGHMIQQNVHQMIHVVIAHRGADVCIFPYELADIWCEKLHIADRKKCPGCQQLLDRKSVRRKIEVKPVVHIFPVGVRIIIRDMGRHHDRRARRYFCLMFLYGKDGGCLDDQDQIIVDSVWPGAEK